MCSGVQTLWLSVKVQWHPPILPALAATKPRRLSTYLRVLFDSPNPIHEMLASITHLHIFDWNLRSSEITRWLPQCPALAYVALNVGSPALTRETLASCWNLQVLICLHPPWSGYRGKDELISVDDDRLVYMHARAAWNEEEWITGTKGGADFWVHAETFIAKKRRGEIEPSSRCWIEPKDDIGSKYIFM
ncbi:hypothetical protein K438DRAFT_2022608 [Mycena galopus ATCC 62051]|nr:hypothetical protein K438DRAFT_2022608 [Mycena galopus ATCC 62051]